MSRSEGTRWAESSPTERKTEIMRNLADILRERHVSSLTMQDIADRLGMTKGNLYYYFPSKQELLFQCHMKGMEDGLRLLDGVMQAKQAPSVRLTSLVHDLVASVIRDPYGVVLTTDLDSLSKTQKRRYIALRDQFEMGLRSLITEGIAAGEFKTQDVKLAGFAILGSINSIGRWHNSAGERSPEFIADVFAKLLVGGLRASD